MSNETNRRLVYRELHSYSDCSNGNGLRVAPEAISRLEKVMKHNTAILGGHYIPDFNLSKRGIISDPDPVSTLSFDIAAKLYSDARYKFDDIKFCILIGDISYCEPLKEIDMAKYERVHDELLNNYHFPEAYSKILDKYNINGEKEIIPISELYLRNSADDLLENLIEISENEKETAMLHILRRKEDENTMTYYTNTGIEIGKENRCKRRVGKKSQHIPSQEIITNHANCRLIQVELLDLLSKLDTNRVIDIRNDGSYKCNYQYGPLYHQALPTLIRLFGEHVKPVDVINASLLYDHSISDNLLATQRFWLYEGDPSLALLENA